MPHAGRRQELLFCRRLPIEERAPDRRRQGTNDRRVLHAGDWWHGDHAQQLQDARLPRRHARVVLLQRGEQGRGPACRQADQVESAPDRHQDRVADVGARDRPLPVLCEADGALRIQPLPPPARSWPSGAHRRATRAVHRTPSTCFSSRARAAPSRDAERGRAVRGRDRSRRRASGRGRSVCASATRSRGMCGCLARCASTRAKFFYQIAISIAASLPPKRTPVARAHTHTYTRASASASASASARASLFGARDGRAARLGLVEERDLLALERDDL